MQKIFYNAKFYTLNDGEEVAEAMLVNDGIIVFAGKKDEVFSMKTEDTKLVDLKEKSVLPAFFDMNLSLFKIIENRIIGAEFSRLCASIIFAYNNGLTIFRKAFRWFIPLYWDRVSHYR